MLDRTQTKVPVDRDKFRYRVIVKTDPCPPETLESKRLQFELLRHISEDPMLSSPGGSLFQTMKMRHDGVGWVAEFESIVHEPEKK